MLQPQSIRRPRSRRRLLHAMSVAAGTGLLGVLGGSVARTAAQDGDLPDLVEFQRLVAANRILANEGVVDAFGHVSIRHPDNPDLFVMSRSRSPALVEHSDLMEFDMEGRPLDLRGRTAYGERMIHAAIYATRPDVHSVVHHHAYGVLPFTVTDVPLRPVVHAASVIGADIPVWDIRDDYDDTDMLVRSIEQGRNLAATLGDNTCLLMRGHGAVVVGADVQRAVLTAVYLQVNADVLLRASRLGEPMLLSDDEIRLSAETQFSPLAMPRVWEYFCQRAGIEAV